MLIYINPSTLSLFCSNIAYITAECAFMLEKQMFVCTNTHISVIIKAKGNKFGIIITLYSTQMKHNLNISYHIHCMRK